MSPAFQETPGPARLARLAALPILAPLDDAGRVEFARLGRTVVIPRGSLVFVEGSAGDAVYVVEAGEVEVVRGHGSPEARRLALLKVGDYFGEMGILEESTRQATVHSPAGATLFRVSREDFLRFVAAHPIVEMKLRSGLVRRHTENIAGMFKR